MDDFTALVAFGYFLTIPLIGAIVAAVRAASGPRTRASVVETCLRCYLLFWLAIPFLWNFVVHTFFGDQAAPLIGWAPSPFEAEVGVASLGFALVALYAYRNDLRVRIAAVIGPAVFLLGAAIGHIVQMVVADNHAAGNSGFIFYMDILVPLVGFVLLAMSARSARALRNTSPVRVAAAA